METSASAFYTVANSDYFVGLVAMINSLRLLGHEQPIHVTDAGLSAGQRSRLGEHVVLVDVEPTRAPALAKVIGPLTHPADVMVLIDADMIATSSFADVIRQARGGKVVACIDSISNRFDHRWSDLLGLSGMRRQPYANAGLIVCERDLGVGLLDRISAGFKHLDVDRSVAAYGSPDYPFYYLEQDLLNAYLATYPVEQVALLEHRLAPVPPFPSLRLRDESMLECVYPDGVAPLVLHHIKRKPWLRPTRSSIYTRLLTRLLLAHDVVLPLGRDEVPRRLQTGALAVLERRRAEAQVALGTVRARLALRTRLRRGRRSN